MKKFIITMVFALVAVLNVNGQNISKNDSILNALEMSLDSLNRGHISGQYFGVKLSGYNFQYSRKELGATNEKDAVKMYKKQKRREKERQRNSSLWMGKYGIYLNNPSEINPYEHHFN